MTVSNQMANGNDRIPRPVNEPVRAYAPGSPERASIQKRLGEMLHKALRRGE